MFKRINGNNIVVIYIYLWLIDFFLCLCFILFINCCFIFMLEIEGSLIFFGIFFVSFFILWFNCLDKYLCFFFVMN